MEQARESYSPQRRASHSRSPSAQSNSADRPVSPFRKKLSLANPNTLLAPGAVDIAAQPKATASKWDIPPDSENAIGMSATGPCVPIIPGTDFSVPPPDFYP